MAQQHHTPASYGATSGEDCTKRGQLYHDSAVTAETVAPTIRAWQRVRWALAGSAVLGVAAMAATHHGGSSTVTAQPPAELSSAATSSCASALDKCGGGASYAGPTECCDSGYSCFAKTESYSQCKLACEEGWLCADAAADASATTCATNYGQCGGKSWGGSSECCDESFSCFAKTESYSQCRKTCGSAEDGWACATEAEDEDEDAAATETAKAATPPHILMVLADDLGWNDIGYGSEDLKGVSPILDALALDGVRLTNFYSQHLCTPARSALLTGKYPIHTGTQHEEVIAPMSPWGLNLSHVLLPEVLSASGAYDAHAVGKWHLGHFSFSYLPTARGFSSFTGYLSDQIHYFNHTYPQVLMGVSCTDLFRSTPTAFETLTGKDGVLSDILYRETMAEIIKDAAAQDDKSLFLYFASQATHGPLDDMTDTSMFSVDQQRVLDTVTNAARHRFAKLVMVLDNTVGTVIDTLKDTGMWENTLLVFASDNGGCAKSGSYNNPLRGGKHFLFEGGLKVRAFVSGPALPDSARGSSYAGLMHISDLFPTILEAANVAVPAALASALDSVSQWKHLTGTAAANAVHPRSEIVHNIDLWEFPTPETAVGLTEEATGLRGALRRGDMKLIMHTWPQGWYKPPTDTDNVEPGVTAHPIEDCNSPPARYNVSNWLFNITADPNEERNLYHLVEYKPIRDELKEYLSTLADTMSTPEWVGEDPRAIETFRSFQDFITPWKEIDVVYSDPDALVAVGGTSKLSSR